MKTAKIKLTFLEPVLGSSPNDEDIYTRFIGDKAPDAMSLKEEIESLGEEGADIVAERGTTVFPRDEDGTPIFWSYQIEGFFKGTCGFLRTVPGTLSSKLKAYKKQIDGRIFVEGDVSPTNKTGRKIRIKDAFLYPPSLTFDDSDSHRDFTGMLYPYPAVAGWTCGGNDFACAAGCGHEGRGRCLQGSLA